MDKGEEEEKTNQAAMREVRHLRTKLGKEIFGFWWGRAWVRQAMRRLAFWGIVTHFQALGPSALIATGKLEPTQPRASKTPRSDS